MNMSMYAGFRADLVRESGQSQYAAEAPQDLDAELQSSVWESMVGRLARWQILSGKERLLVARVVAALTLRRYLIGLLEATDIDVSRDAASAGLGQILAMSHFLVQDQVKEVPLLLLGIAETAPEGSLPCLQARMSLAQISIDYLGRVDDARSWLDRAGRSLPTVLNHLTPFDATRLNVRFLVLGARIRHGAGALATLDDLERALETVRALRPETDEQGVLRREALRRVLDKLALAQRESGDIAAAKATAEAAVESDPHDAKARWLLAELHFMTRDFVNAAALFRNAAELGPVAAARSWFLAGQSHERLGELPAALECYDAAVSLDPGSPSVAEARESCRTRAKMHIEG